MIVFRITDSDDVMRREAKLSERDVQSGCLVHSGWKDHHRALVEDDLQLQPKIAYELNGGRLMRAPRCNDDASDRDSLCSAFDELLPELIRRPLGERPFFARRGPKQQRAVFRNDSIEKIEPRENFDQVVQFPSGNKNEFSSGFTNVFKGKDSVFADFPVPCDRPVVIACQGVVPHKKLMLQMRYLRSRQVD